MLSPILNKIKFANRLLFENTSKCIAVDQAAIEFKKRAVSVRTTLKADTVAMEVTQPGVRTFNDPAICRGRCHIRCGTRRSPA